MLRAHSWPSPPWLLPVSCLPVASLVAASCAQVAEVVIGMPEQPQQELLLQLPVLGAKYAFTDVGPVPGHSTGVLLI